jgi:hypothetical protein
MSKPKIFLINIVRRIQSDNSIIGILVTPNLFKCYTLELPWLNNTHNISCIPAGIYQFRLEYSHKNNLVQPLLLNVPNRNNIEIHKGNFPHDTKGCILVGTGYDTDRVYGSTAAFDNLMLIINNALKTTQSLWIDIAHQY